jgi:hypothetical protein
MAFSQTAIPRSGSSDVSPATSLVILSPTQPSQLTLVAGATEVPLDGVTMLGAGIDGTTGLRTQFWRVRLLDPLLPASAELVLTGFGASAIQPSLTRVMLTTFVTAAGYDKNNPGTPAVIKSLSLRRVRYPLSDIGAGFCVFAEYQGYITVDIEPAVIPGTPPESVVSTVTLAPRHGGAAEQSFMFTGPAPFLGYPPLPSNYPTSGERWMPDLDPTLEYCASISSFGFNDLAVLPVVSNSVCATVEQIAVPGAGEPADGGSDAGADAGAGSGADLDAAVDAGDDAKVPPPASSGGCSLAGGVGARGLPLLAPLVVLARRRQGRQARPTVPPRD